MQEAKSLRTFMLTTSIYFALPSSQVLSLHLSTFMMHTTLPTQSSESPAFLISRARGETAGRRV